MPECQSNLFCSPLLLYILWASSSISPQPPFTCPSLSQPLLRLSYPSSHQILPPLRSEFVLNLCPSNLKYLGVWLLFALMPPLTCNFPSVLVSVFPLPSSPHHHSLSSLISSHAPFFCLFCSPVCRFSGSVHSPRQPSLGSLSSPSECSLGDMKPCQLPMSLLEHNTVGQADANIHAHTDVPSTFLHTHKSKYISQHTHADTQRSSDRRSHQNTV